MLMQNFKSADELGITEPQFDALRKTLVLLETGKLQHAIDFEYRDGDGALQFTGHFSMDDWGALASCGTVACIGGTAELVGKLEPDELYVIATRDTNPALRGLFYPDLDMNWDNITPDQAATALRSYLTTGDAKWHEAVAPTQRGLNNAR